MSENKKRHELPEETKWKLSDIYADINAWESEFKKLSDMLPEAAALKDSMMSSASELLAGLRKIDEASLLLERLFVYARMGRDQDNSNGEYQSLVERISGLMTKFSEAVSWYEPLLLSAPEGTIEAYIESEPALADYRFNLEDVLRNKEHILSEKEEKLLSMVGDFSGGAQTIFTMLNNADLRFEPVELENGEKEALSHAKFISILRTGSRETREKAYENYYNEFKKYTNTITAAYATSVKKDVFYAKARGFSSARERALFADNVPVSVYDSLIDSINRNLPVMHRYATLRKKLLGVDKLHMYDVYTPLVSDVGRKYTYEEGSEMILKGLAPLGEDYIEVVKKALTEGWIDVYENEGKTSGAYSWGVYGVHPYMLLNYSGDLDSVFTLAHEMGHSMHTYYSNEAQPYVTSSYKIFVAEIASTVNEILLTKYLLKNAEDKKLRAYLLNNYIEQMKGTVLRQTMFAEFEMIAHEMAEKGEPLTSTSLCKVYGDLNAKYFGPDMERDDTICYEWSRIPHFYNAFYVYKYATGYSCASAIVRNLEKEGGLEKYRSFLASGGSAHPLDLIKIAGIDFSTAVDECMAEFDRALGELEEIFNTQL